MNSSYDQSKVLNLAVEMRERLIDNVARNVGPRRGDVIDLLLVCLLSEGHFLLEGESGAGKTMLFDAFARSFNMTYRKIPMTVDLWPPDIFGSTIVQNAGSHTVEYFQPGPIFTNLLLLDNINRASPRVLPSLLGVLNDGKVTVNGDTYSQISPFMACATRSTQDDGEGTYQLSADQLDRFLLSAELKHLSVADVSELLYADIGEDPSRLPIAFVENITALQAAVKSICLTDKIIDKIAHIGAALRDSEVGREYVASSLSLRGAIKLKQAVQALSLVRGRWQASMDDLHHLLIPALRHRIVLTFSARAQGIEVIDIIKRVM